MASYPARILRSLAARSLRPVFAMLDRRLEQLAARLELHTTNLSDAQRHEIARIDQRLVLDVAVVSEHLLGIERMAHRVATSAPGRLVIARPGEALAIPAGALGVDAYTPEPDGSWRLVDTADDTTLRIVRLPDPTR